MAATDTLLDALRIPWKIVIYDRFAKLKIEAFCTRFGRYEHFRARFELVNECHPHGDVATWSRMRRERFPNFIVPTLECSGSTGLTVLSPKKCHVVVREDAARYE